MRVTNYLTGSWVAESSLPCVYAWIRGGAYLYVGYAKSGVKRVLYHNLIGKVEEVLDTDEIRYWLFTDETEARQYEAMLQESYQPKYSSTWEQRKARGLGRKLCIKCNTVFTAKRWWQVFCSDTCRLGVN